jgi:Ca2+-binding EF-hand superfamily protein/predicted small lipoprotein YifL
MNASNRNLLAIALATALLSPAALAQKGGVKGPPELPRTSNQAPIPNSPEQTMRDLKKPVTKTTEQADTTLPPPSPPQSQGAEHAAAHSSVVTRDLWARLDLDGDGRISTTEGAADADFNADFASIDSNDDGFVSDTEYRTAAKTELKEDRRVVTSNDASSQAATGLGDALRRLDANADGSISLGEANADASFKTSFGAIDSNSDGLVTRAEYQVWLKANRK